VNSSSPSDRFCLSSIIELSQNGTSSVYHARCFAGSRRFFASPPPPCHLKRLREQSLIENLRLREVAYEEVHFLLPGAPLAEGHAPDLHDCWVGTGVARLDTYLARPKPFFPREQEVLPSPRELPSTLLLGCSLLNFHHAAYCASRR